MSETFWGEIFPSFVTWWSQKIRSLRNIRINPISKENTLEHLAVVCTCLERKLFLLRKFYQLAILIKIIKLQRIKEYLQSGWHETWDAAIGIGNQQDKVSPKLFICKEIGKENAIHFVTLTNCKVTLMLWKRTFLRPIALVCGKPKKKGKKKSKSSNQFSIIIMLSFFVASLFYATSAPNSTSSFERYREANTKSTSEQQQV